MTFTAHIGLSPSIELHQIRHLKKEDGAQDPSLIFGHYSPSTNTYDSFRGHSKKETARPPLE